MSLLENLVYGDEGLECLDLVGKDGLDLHGAPEGLGGLVVPREDDAAPDMFALGCRFVGAGSLFDIDRELSLGPGFGRHDC